MIGSVLAMPNLKNLNLKASNLRHLIRPRLVIAIAILLLASTPFKVFT
jgi:hypothetical protein